MEKLLRDYSPKEKGVVKSVSAAGALRRRLFDMGLTPGAEVMMKKAAPMGDPIEFEVRGYALSLRRSEAECVVTEVKA